MLLGIPCYIQFAEVIFNATLVCSATSRYMWLEMPEGLTDAYLVRFSN